MIVRRSLARSLVWKFGRLTKKKPPTAAKELESEVNEIDGRVGEIEAELAEDERKRRLAELEKRSSSFQLRESAGKCAGEYSTQCCLDQRTEKSVETLKLS